MMSSMYKIVNSYDENDLEKQRDVSSVLSLDIQVDRIN